MARNQKSKWVVGMTLTGLMLLFQNCGQQVSFVDSESAFKLTGERLIIVDDGDGIEGQSSLPLLQDQFFIDEALTDISDEGTMMENEVVFDDQAPTQQEAVIEVVMVENNTMSTEEEPTAIENQEVMNEAPVVTENPILNESLPVEVVAEEKNEIKEEIKEEKQEMVEVIKEEKKEIVEMIKEEKQEMVQELKEEKQAAVEEKKEEILQQETDNNVPTQEIVGEAQHYLCVVAGKGKSTHIGLIEEVLAKNSTPNSLCMTKNACLNIMSQSFDVIEAKYTGFCKNDKAHTFRIADGDAVALINQLNQ